MSEGRYELEQVTIRKTNKGWQAIVKVMLRRRAFVSFLDCDTFTECLEYVGEWAYGGHLVFAPDQWPTKRSKGS